MLTDLRGMHVELSLLPVSVTGTVIKQRETRQSRCAIAQTLNCQLCTLYRVKAITRLHLASRISVQIAAEALDD